MNSPTPEGSFDRRVLDRFMIMGTDGAFAELDRELTHGCPRSAPAGAVFRSNVEAAVSVARIPFLMANAASVSQRYHQLHTAAAIRALKSDETGRVPDEDQRKRMAAASARATLNTEISSGVLAEHVKFDILHRLQAALDDPAFDRAASDLLSETLVMLWGALEALVRDVVSAHLNACPTAALGLMSADGTRHLFPSRGVGVDALRAHGFNLASVMGDVLLADRHLDNLPAIREVFKVLVPGSANLHTTLGEDRLWKLWQRRHLIVHRRGIVDQAYLQKTGDGAPLGTRLPVSSDDVEEALGVIVCSGVAILLSIRMASQN